MQHSSVAVCAIIAGGLASAADLAVSWPLVPPNEQRAAKDVPTPTSDRLCFEACVVFWGVAYATGRLMYYLLGDETSAQELRRWSQWHMTLLGFLGGFMLIAGGWKALGQAHIVRPSFVIGALMAILAARDAWKAFRRKRTNQHFGELVE